ncbi:hypothetical protein IQ22_02835 [Pseudomonas duriflava]|uniref:Uncharacterized protein n=1 Tax=Pseudomonas duriflava TaxID=459528 RepID=A0A562Q8E8_9PSED|nr:hypothetical protein [Pseudomonas duriflava]TWI52999.1 hypothetical protein IQ22_02835 [Pseudomonas duriflava]
MEVSRALVECMLTVRRHLRDEGLGNFTLQSKESIHNMIVACALSQDDKTRALGIRLQVLSGLPEPVTEPSFKASAEFLVDHQKYTGPLRG